jgi:DNA-binding MarR family transcriptional regulator
MSRNGGPRKGAEGLPLAEELERDLGSIRRFLRKPLEAEVARGELTAPQLAIMREVVRRDGISLKDLSRAVSLAHSTVSGIVDRLEKRGMVVRKIDPADARISRIHPTPVVKDFIRDRLPTLERGPLETALENTTAAERTKIAEGVRRLRILLEKSSRVS